MLTRFTALLILLVLISSSSGCGFRPRTTTVSAEELQTIQLQSQVRNGELTQAIKRALTSAGTTIVDEAETVLVIHEESVGRRAASLTSNARVASFEITYVVSFSLLHKDKALINHSSIRSEKSYRYDENDISAKTEEENLLKREMRRDIVRKLVYQLNAAFAQEKEMPPSEPQQPAMNSPASSS